MKKLTLLVCCLILPIVSYAQNKVALVIGNSQYQATSDVLKNPVNDAKAVATRFKELGFDTQILLNANLNSMLDALDQLHQKVSKDGTLVVYYAGHGIQVDGENYIVPIDASMSQRHMIKRQTIQVQEMLSNLEQTKAAHRIVILDACRNDPFPKQYRSGIRGLAREQPNLNSGSVVLYAASPNEVADDGQGKHGVFTQALLKALKQENVYLPIMLDDIAFEVRRNTSGRQNPRYEGTGLARFMFLENDKVPLNSTPVKIQDIIHTQDVSNNNTFHSSNELDTAKQYFKDKKYPEAFALFKSLAEKDDAETQTILGAMYRYGISVPQNLPEMVFWYKKASNQGFATGQYLLGQVYHVGLSVRADAEQAFEWYKKAAEQGHGNAQYALAALYDNGQGVKRNNQQANYWYKKAFVSLEKLAMDGDSDAQYSLGRMYMLGSGIKKDVQQAFYWSNKAAQQQNSDAMISLYVLYDNGWGITKNKEKAKYWLNQSSSQGFLGYFATLIKVNTSKVN